MAAIFEREFKSYFNGVTGYVFAAFTLFFIGIYVKVINFSSAYPNFEYVLSNMSFVYILMVPVLTMKSVADERRQKTDQLLYSLPMSMTRVVLGKYLAMLAVLLVPVLILCAYPLILSAYGAVNLGVAYSAVLGFFFMGAALLSMGLFISSLTENIVLSFVLGVGVMLLNYFISSLANYVSGGSSASFAALTATVLLVALVVWLLTKNSVAAMFFAVIAEAAMLVCYIVWKDRFAGIFPDVMGKLSLFDRFYSFIDGVLDIRSLVYFLTVVGIFLFLTVQSLEKRRWS